MAASPPEHKAFETELVALIPQLRAFGRHLCGSHAMGDDLAQDTLAKALASRDSFQMGTNMKAWTFMILRNLFFSDKRRSWRSCELDPEVAERSLVAVTNPTSALELDELRRAMSMLSADHREALILIGAAGLSYEEASAITGVPVGTVKSRVSRARNHLALIYAEGVITSDDQPAQGAMASIFRQADDYRAARCA
jgi:RNA polymerase sigma-70 factor (ECF subfamily)